MFVCVWVWVWVCVRVCVCVCLCVLNPDHQAVGHRHGEDPGPPPPPHHAHHGLRSAAVSAAPQPGPDGPRKELLHSLLAGVAQTHDCRKLPREFAGTDEILLLSALR